MAQEIGVTTRTIKRDTEFLVKNGKLARDGGYRNGRWIVMEKGEYPSK